MKKRVMAMALASAMVLSMTAPATAADEGQEIAGGKDVSLTLWLTPSWKGVFSGDEPDADYDSFFKEAAKRYNEMHPNVTINVEVIAGDSRDEKLNVAESTDTLPDIVYEGAFTMSSYYHKGSIVALDDIISEDDKADIADGIWENCQVEGATFIFPFAHMPGTLIYNADMFKTAGLDDYIKGEYEIATWSPDELREILTALRDCEELGGVYPMSLFCMNNQADTWNLTYLRMFGNTFFDETGHLCVNEENGVKALQYILDLSADGLTVPGAESLTSNDCNAMFQNQQIAVSFTNSTLYTNLQTDMSNGTVEPFDARLANIPGDPEPHSFTYVSGFMAMNTGDEDRIAASKDFIQYVCTDEELVLASKNTLPVRTSVTEQVKDEMPLLEAYNANAQYIFNFSNNMPGYNELRNVLFPELQAALIGQKTAQEALDDYVEKGNQVIDEGRANSVVYNQ
ncbi:ABC transporter, solute-binding protein [Marvinbryantia formatexigens DSM 14469]|uniref:ABC transporter, solute-binding protein n=1 Tax=Marvinbryantia formatexigens DSM 14469 TaxID=478749 RepID=C6L8R6_9FIRM|nr:extracellular solute-binding protein [Marvinbryantia formatexigens]EET62655.1 ABC transporter, solute-binding protein [Marvinbryantia formatexigens DSM 14469]UWO23035.1 extracellular solute-binding protein [Marvinbryantia formatexigens DSM 14469]SDF96670.1 multiple sugar transport system substrate-binding protein [Marvinbryantia formatexigens]